MPLARVALQSSLLLFHCFQYRSPFIIFCSGEIRILPINVTQLWDETIMSVRVGRNFAKEVCPYLHTNSISIFEKVRRISKISFLLSRSFISFFPAFALGHRYNNLQGREFEKQSTTFHSFKITHENAAAYITVQLNRRIERWIVQCKVNCSPSIPYNVQYNTTQIQHNRIQHSNVSSHFQILVKCCCFITK